MQKNDNLLKVARKIVDLRKQLDTVTTLRDKAFTPFEDRFYFSLDKISDIIFAWSELSSWTRTSAYHYGTLIIRDYNDLIAKFNLLSNAHINREEFRASQVAVKACEAVEKYIDDLTKEISKLEKQLDTLYNQFAKNTGDLSFIFKEPKVKDIIINKILFS
ncbi:MAG: hypothetical protein HFJ41_05085 [Clostridia bacterium]|nr:hypothetical protein [Clostridia bacterium]